MEIDFFIRNLTWDRLSPETREITKRCTLDALGCSLVGVQAENFSSLVQSIKQLDERKESPIWGTEISSGLPWSIFLNSYTASYFDIDDGHRRAQGHPGAAIVPAALCTANYLSLSGKTFLEAVVTGYEIAIRSALMMRDLGGPRKGSGGWVVPGVAAAVSKLMNLNTEKILDAIGIAEYFSLQAPQDRSASFPSHMKEGIPWAAYTGYISAFLASNGFHGMRPHLADSPFIRDLSIKYEIDNVYFKRYACCRWAHPALDGLEKLLKEKGCHFDEIDQIRIKTFDKATLLDRRDPSNTMEAVYSIPYAVGCYLIHGKLGPREVSGEYLQDPRVHDLSSRVQLVAAPELTKLFPAQCLQQIEVIFKENNRYESDILSAKGDPDNPFSYDEILFKFKMLTENIIGARWQEVPKAIHVLEDIPASALIDLMHGGSKTAGAG